MHMKLVFTKGAGKFDLMQIVGTGRSMEMVACPKQRIIPHDMVHYAVEHTLALRGFLARMSEGEAVAFQMQGEAESDAVERLVEVFQGDEWSGGTSSASDLIEMYRITCQARSCPMLGVDEQSMLDVRAAIADLTGRWAAVAVGGVLELSLTPEADARES